MSREYWIRTWEIFFLVSFIWTLAVVWYARSRMNKADNIFLNKKFNLLRHRGIEYKKAASLGIYGRTYIFVAKI